MKKVYFTIIALTLFVTAYSQTQHLSNGGFEANPWNSLWSTPGGQSTPNGGTGGFCTAPEGSSYVWFGSGNGQFAADNYSGEIRQDFIVPPSNNGYPVAYARVYFKASINTNEIVGAGAYDPMYVDLYYFGGAFIQTIGTLSCNNGQNGFNTCQQFNEYYFDIPNTYLGNYLIISFKATSDAGLPTIYRLDDIRIEATYNCDLNPPNVNNTNVSLGSAAANNVTVASVNTGTQQSGCNWSASVTSGNSWLTCSSSAEGNGDINVTAQENTTTSSRVGTIDVVGSAGPTTITVTQAGANCTYTLSNATYNCPDFNSNIYTNIVNVTAPTGCPWSASVTVGPDWLSTTSSGDGPGSITILVSTNTTPNSRTGKISVNGTILTVNQPGNNTSVNSIEESTMSVFPNPASKVLNVYRSNPTSIEEYQMVNVLGQVVLSGTLTGQSTAINIESLPKAVYFITFTNSAKAVKVIVE